MWEDIWYWFLAWHVFLCSTTVSTCCPGENNNNKSHNHCNLRQLQLPRLISSQFLGHRQTVESLLSIMVWPPVEKLGQRCINNRNGVQTRNSHPACCSLSLATQIICKIFVSHCLKRSWLQMVCVCHSTGTDRLEATNCDPVSSWVPGQLHSAADGHFRAERWNYGLVLGTTIQIFSRH